MNNLYDVFISYRRSDGLTIAEALYKYLTSKGLRVFFDKHEMIDGHYFTTQIESNLKTAPNYILIATDDVFKFRQGEDWVRKEIEIAINEYESNPTERTITVLVPEAVTFPEKEVLPESVRNICDAQRISLPYGDGFAEPFKSVLKSVTNINRRNLWFAAHRWLENSKQPGGRFASLNINESILPNASGTTKEHKEIPINVYSKENHNDGDQPLLEAMGQSNNHLYLIGQGGIGKTTALMHIMNNAYVDKQYSESTQIPIFVELSFAPDTYGALYEGGKSSFIRRSIYKQVREDRTIKQVTTKEVSDVDEVFTTLPYDVAVNPINDILSKTSPAPEYLLLLDGLNEVSSVEIKETGLSIVQMIMSEIDLLLRECPNVKVVLTSRSDESAICNDSISRLYLSGVQEKTVKDYLESSDFSKEQIDKALKDKNLCNTLQIPLFLTMFATLKNADEVSTQGEILKLFFNERRKNTYVYTMQNRLAVVEKNVSDAASAVQKNRIDADMQSFILDFILPEIAWQMERKDEFYLSLRDIRKLIEPILNNTDDISVCGDFGQELFAKYRNGASAKMHTSKVAKKFFDKLGDNIKEITESIVDCCVFAMGIMQENNSKYGFVHQHIRDYFAAVKNINTLRLSSYLYEEDEEYLALECMNKTFKDEPINITVRRFMGEAIGEHRNKPYLQDGVWYYNVPEEKCDRNLIERALDVYRNKFDGECGYGIYSLITILKEVRKDLSGEDFSYLDMKYCNFNGTVLGRPFLSSKFDGALVNNYTFMPWGNGEVCLGMAVSPDEKIIARVGNDAKVRIWNIEPFSFIKEIKIDVDPNYVMDFMQYWSIDSMCFDEKGENLKLVINYYMLVNDDTIIQKLIKTDVFLISTDNFEVKTIKNSDNTKFNKDSSKFYVYGNFESDFWFCSNEQINLDSYTNLCDLKKVPEGGNFMRYQEYLNHGRKLSLCRFNEGLALYDISSGALINRYYGNFDCMTSNDFKVRCSKNNIVVIYGDKIFLFDSDLNFIAEKKFGESISIGEATVSEKYIFLSCSKGKIIVLSSITLNVLDVIESSKGMPVSLYFTKDGSTAFFNTSNDIGFVYDLNKNSAIDFAEAFTPGGDKDLVRPKNIFDIETCDFEDDIQYISFSNRSPAELLTVTGYRSLHQKNENSDYNSNGLHLSVEKKDGIEVVVVLRNSDMEVLGVIESLKMKYGDMSSLGKLKAIFNYDNDKIVVLESNGPLAFIDTNELLSKKTVSFEDLHQTGNEFPFHDFMGRELGIFPVPDNTIATTHRNTIKFWDLDKKALSKQIEHIGGLYVIDVELNKLHSKSELSEDTKQKLRQYGAVI